MILGDDFIDGRRSDDANAFIEYFHRCIRFRVQRFRVQRFRGSGLRNSKVHGSPFSLVFIY